MIWVKLDSFRNLLVQCNGETKIYHYNTFEEFVDIFRNEYYDNIMFQRNFYNDRNNKGFL